MRKNSFLAFISALLPGAGHMYFGLMNKGLVLMSVFFMTIATSAFFYIEFLLWLLPVIWFYSFYDALNLKNLSQEEREKLNSEFLSKTDKNRLINPLYKLFGKRHLLFGLFFIALGLYVVLNVSLDWLITYYQKSNNYNGDYWEFIQKLEYIRYTAVRSLPTVFIGIGVCILGVYLIKGQKRSEPPNEILPAYKRENCDRRDGNNDND